MPPIPAHTQVFDSYWRFAAERLAMYYRRMIDPVGPWTENPILREYRFTNVYRAADRVSQYLVRKVQYREDRSQAPAEVFFRTVLFKLFNRIDTWELLEQEHGPLSWQSTPIEKISESLDHLIGSGRRVYSAAYIMPSPAFGHQRKHSNHLALLARMMTDGLPGQLVRARSLRSVYEMILSYPGLGPFLAFQYTIDLNYSTLLDFDEAEFVVAGPGALDGIAKCFANAKSFDPTYIIYAMAERQSEEFSRLGLEFEGLFGRRLQPIDCQNIFCEISKYARVAHPEVDGSSGRTRIKQRYRAADAVTPEAPYFPPKWNLKPPPLAMPPVTGARSKQLLLL
jgi:5-hmdU DNA kinase-like protein